MALTLNSTLATSQNSLERQPIVELISTELIDAIPFDGQYLNDLTETEKAISFISGSTGQLVAVFIRDEEVIFLYTDVDRTNFTEVTLNNPTGTVTETALVELANGNLGIVYVTYTGSTYYIRQMTVSTKGGILVAGSVLDTFASITIQGPYIIRLANGTYLLTYCKLEASVYSIQKRTSVNFLTWTSESEITVTGLDTSEELDKTALVQGANGDVILAFDYADDSREDGSQIKNIYTMVSEDNGSTWDTPSALTSYSSWGTFGAHPDLSITSTDVLKLTYHEEKNVLFIDADTPLWQEECDGANEGGGLHFDASTNRLYAYQISSNRLCGITVINTETWSVDTNYNTSTSPAYNSLFAASEVRRFRSLGYGHRVLVSVTEENPCAYMLIDNNAKTITEYYFKDNAEYDITTNITNLTWPSSRFKSQVKIMSSFLDVNNNRIYTVLYSPYIWHLRVIIGYIEIDDAQKTWNEVYDSGNNAFGIFEIAGTVSALFIEDLNAVAIGMQTSATGGRLTIISLATGGKLYDFRTSLGYPAFPLNGVNHMVYYQGHIYASFLYQSGFGQEDYRGMVDINLNNEVITYHRPSWATRDDYRLRAKHSTGDGKILVCVNEFGVAVFDINTTTWTLYDNNNLPGFEPGSYYNPLSLSYDSENELIFVGSAGVFGENAYSGVRAFSESGAFQKGKYTSAEYVVDTWTWESIANLTSSNYSSSLASTTDEEDVLWALWRERDITEYSIKWDSDNASLDMESYLLTDRAVTIEFAVDGYNRLDFSLSHGHLFDPNNQLSLLSKYTQKGMRILLKFGEKINGVEYLQEQGTYIINSVKMSYSRGTYPVIDISCEDKRSIWEQVQLTASDRYDDQDPEDLIGDILETFLGLTASEYSIDTFADSHTIYHQWIDTKVIEAIDELLDHFGYISYMDVDDVFTTKRINTSKAVDHDYTSLNTQIINFTPDDNYSSFTNRVTVKGEGLEFLEVIYPEELIQSISGTGGWWSDKDKVIRVYYSDDQQKRCRAPRLNVIKSIKDFKILWEESGGDEYISDIDDDEKYVEITIEYPGITEVLIASITTLTAVGAQAANCDATQGCGGYMVAFSLLVASVSWILGQVATYEYEIYAQPVGDEKQTLYADADDLEFQQSLNGQVVNEEIDDPFCYTIASCQTVADQELDIVKAQRKRVSLEKITHLQDEICDVIKINHPYSNQELDIFITNLKRTFIKPSKNNASGGSFIDSITGWII